MKRIAAIALGLGRMRVGGEVSKRVASIALVSLALAGVARAQDEIPETPPAEAPAEGTREPTPEAPVEPAAPAEAPPADTPVEAPAEAAPANASPYVQPSASPYPGASSSPYATAYPQATTTNVGASAAPAAAPAGEPAPQIRNWWGAFEFRFGGSMGYAALDLGPGVQRSHGYGGFVGMEFAQPIARMGDAGYIFFALTWNAIELRNSDPEGWVVGGTDAGAGAGVRLDFDVDTYLQIWAGYLFAGDTQAVYPDAGDLLAMWHLAYARARFRLGFLALELGGGAGVGQHVLVGLRIQLADSFWLGADLNGYFAGREDHPSRWGRELWITRAFFAIRWE